MKILPTIIITSLFAVSCGSFKAERVDANKSDEKGLSITDNWMSADTTQAVTDIIKQTQADALLKVKPFFNTYIEEHLSDLHLD